MPSVTATRLILGGSIVLIGLTIGMLASQTLFYSNAAVDPSAAGAATSAPPPPPLAVLSLPAQRANAAAANFIARFRSLHLLPPTSYDPHAIQTELIDRSNARIRNYQTRFNLQQTKPLPPAPPPPPPAPAPKSDDPEAGHHHPTAKSHEHDKATRDAQLSAVLTEQQKQRRWCFESSERHGVIPGNTFGSLNAADQRVWADYACDGVIKMPVAGKHSYPFVCKLFAETYNVQIGQNWGRMTPQLQAIWANLKCDAIMHHYDSIIAEYGSDHKLLADRRAAAAVEMKQLIRDRDSMNAETEQYIKQMHALRTTEEQHAQCRKWAKQFGVSSTTGPGDWSGLPPALRAAWHDVHCDQCHLYLHDAPADEATPYVRTGKEELIAIATGTTTRNVHATYGLDDLALFNTLMLSVAHTIERGFDYGVYIAFDEGDKFYDRPNSSVLSDAQKWFESNVAGPARKRGISIVLKMHKFKNVEQKPGPAFNFILEKAYADGAQWFYRVNDDTEMCGRFATKMTSRLKAMGLPYGATGPRCDQGHTAIMTHDFTHRTHMDIFSPIYYPVKLADWWMDDWISHVYGGTRTQRSSDVVVIHHNTKHGTRYSVNESNGKFLQSEIESGNAKIKNYAASKGWTF